MPQVELSKNIKVKKLNMKQVPQKGPVGRNHFSFFDFPASAPKSY